MLKLLWEPWRGFLCDVFFFPITFGGLKSRWSSTNPAAVEPGWCRLLRCGLKHRARGMMGPVGWLIRKTQHEKFVLSCKNICFIFSSLPDFNTQCCVRRGCVFLCFSLLFHDHLEKQQSRNQHTGIESCAPGRSKRCLRWSLPWLAFWCQHTRQKLGEGI